MKKIKAKIRLFFRGIYRVLSALYGFIYDFKRFLFFGGWKENLKDTKIRNYNLMMAYHGLEKSLSYKVRNPNSGWSNAERVFARLKVAAGEKEIGYHDKAAKEVLLRFLSLPVNISKPRAKEMMNTLDTWSFGSQEEHGFIELDTRFYRQGILDNPENFFFSRYSLREFAKKTVEKNEIERAIKLSMKTPSVCNRHPWHIYHSDQREVIDKALSYQQGNKPFGEKIPNLLIITTDLKAFFAGAEHYQHWIDGGLISMSLMYAFHSLGIASCPLNWSQKPKNDKALRKAIEINDSHTIIMMMAVGYPDDRNKVCASKRRPFQEIYSQIKIK